MVALGLWHVFVMMFWAMGAACFPVECASILGDWLIGP